MVHDTPVKFRSLCILTLLAFMRVMGLPGNNVVGDRVRGLGSVRSEGMFEAVRHVLLVAGMVGIDAHWSVEVEAGIIAGHEGAVDWHLMEVDANAMVLSVTVKEHAELKKRVRAIFDAWHHAAGAECSLLHIPMVILGVFVQD